MAQLGAARDQLDRYAHVVLDETEELAKALATDSKENVLSLRPYAEAVVLRARARAAEPEGGLGVRARQAARAADAYARAHPWRTARFAAGLGAVVGAIIGVLHAKD